MPHYSESLITYNLVVERDGKITKCQVISERNFLLMAAGEMRCNANPDLKNFFKSHEIPLCTITYNQPYRNYDINCQLLDRIWKVRYPAHPRKLQIKDNEPQSSVLDNIPDSMKGWANGALNPSADQLKSLNTYGIQQTTDVIYGDSLWMFLKDICNPYWAQNYQAR